MTIDLSGYGIVGPDVYRNPSIPMLYKIGLPQAVYNLASSGALIAMSAEKTGRSPLDKRIVDHPEHHDNVWWGPINIPMESNSFLLNRETALNFLRTRERVFCIDGFAGWDPKYRIKVRVLCNRAYHALFMHNMLIRPTHDELENFSEPDWTLYNAGQFLANTKVAGVTSKVSVAVDFNTREMVILGTQYAGEMKKGVFTVLNYTLPFKDVFPMHCSANEGPDGDTAIFFGLSGTGKTTLSADPKRRLIGDDEHGWSDEGIFNFEGGCYAKCIGLSEEREPDIWRAIRFGTVLENVAFDPNTGVVDYDDSSITENTRAAYQIEYIDNAKIPCVGGHPRNIILLTCDAFGVLPPVSRLTPEQAMYHFISGYTAKVAGTEVGVTEPQATFSACFGAAFLVWHPMVYAELLAKKMQKHNAKAWLVNTGWSGGGYGKGARITLKHTRAIIDAILGGKLDDVPTKRDPVFGVEIPQQVPEVPTEILVPRDTWNAAAAFDAAAAKLANLFNTNFEKYADRANPEVRSAAPKAG